MKIRYNFIIDVEVQKENMGNILEENARLQDTDYIFDLFELLSMRDDCKVSCYAAEIPEENGEHANGN